MHTLKKQKNTKQKGFTIIETLVAIFILLISTTGPLSFAQSGLRASFLARDQIAAFYLAQDAIETIKNIRDNTGLTGGSTWLENLGFCTPASSGDTTVCNLDTGQTNINTTACTNDCPPLNYDKDDKQYVISTADEVSKYTRNIYITEIVPDREAQIVVEVKWDSNFFSEKRIIVQENIYNWVPEYSI